MTAQIWPSMTDYAGAVQSPETSFRLPALAGAEFATVPPFGLPAAASGQNAVVFTASIGPTRTAVRCFTTEPSDGRHRYQSLERHLSGHPVPAMAQASWVGDAVEVNGHVWPVVTMEWVEGDQLHSHVEDHRHDGGALESLTEQWVATCEELRQAGVAHGDLQHGNVIVEPSGRTRLIDFDGVWVADMAASPPSEVGHPNYQHPGRKDNGAWGWSIDWFSALAVFVSLRALAADPSLWDRHMGENLIFTESDFWGDAEIWGRLERSPDRDVRNWSQLLAEACAHEPDAPYELTTILERGLVPVEAPASTNGSTPAPAGADSATPTPARPAPTAESGPPPDGGTQWWVTTEGVVEPEPGPQPSETTPPRVTPTAQPSVDTNEWDWGVPTPAPEPAEPAPTTTGASVRPPTRERPEQQEVQSSWDDTGEEGSLPPPPAPPPAPAGPGAPPPFSAPSTTPSAHHAGPPAPTKGRSVVNFILLFLIALAIGLALVILLNGSQT
ncbi:MAG: phosphotransferase [Actinomycetia bacterium]|nr:phosphotransferase [Actinomycetes bacterium]